MAIAEETVPDKVLNVKREPKGTNRMVGDKDKSDGAKAVNDAIIVVAISWAIVFALVFTLREYING